jgi:hypothetical protein
VSTRIEIRTADDLFAALRAPSEKARRAVLQGVEANPAAALRLGKCQGWDVVDELVHQIYQSCSVSYFRSVVRALAAFDDPRADQVLEKLSHMARDPEVLDLARLRASSPQSGETPPEDARSADSGGARTPSPGSGEALR